MRTTLILALTAAALALAPPANAETRADAIAAARAEAGILRVLARMAPRWIASADDAFDCHMALQDLDTVTQGLIGASEAMEAIALAGIDLAGARGVAPRPRDTAVFKAFGAMNDAMRAAAPSKYRPCESLVAVVESRIPAALVEARAVVAVIIALVAEFERDIVTYRAKDQADIDAALETLVAIARAALAANDFATALEATNGVKSFAHAAIEAVEEIIRAGVGADAPNEVVAAFDAVVAIHDAMRAAALDHTHVAR